MFSIASYCDMTDKFPNYPGPALFLSLLLAVTGCADTSVTTEVDAEEKLSETSGDFDGDLLAGDQFGRAIAAIGDLEGDGVIDLAVGAPFDDDNGPDRGAVWILFMDSNGRVDLEKKISDDDESLNDILNNGDQFGSAVASIGDLNGDGVFDLAVGAPQDSDGGAGRGAVWILFLNADGTVRLTQKISDEAGGFNGDLNNGDQFGGAVADIGDLDGDGVTDLAVGAQQDSDGGVGKGAVWILFMNQDGTVKSTQKISGNEGNFDGNLDPNDHFGSAVAGLGDFDGDGVNDLAVGANQDDDGGLQRGAIWLLYLNTDGSVKSTQKISSDEGEFDVALNDGDQFGGAIANIGDLDDNGVIDLAVGAEQDDDGGPNQGAVWILFMEDNGEVISATKLSSTQGNFGGNLADDNRFGSAVTGINDLDGDGNSDIAVGAPLTDDGGDDKGAAWILFLEEPETDIDIDLSNDNN